MTVDSVEPNTQSMRRKVMMGLTKISLALKSQAWQEAGPHGLTPTQAQILATLRQSPERNLRPSDLAAELGVTPPTVSDSLNTLDEKGLVQKNRAQQDGRSLEISLTAKGRRMAARVAAWPDFLMETVDTLSVEEQEIFLRSLVKMLRALQEKGMIPVARLCPTCSYFRPNVYDDSQRPHHCGFLDAPFGDRNLQVECSDHATAAPSQARRIWSAFLAE
ncbi:MAG: MarR family winged helix-turn-helix transcriptional regulator [Pseudomonadota bacterium]